jgi:hypothetical protein
VRIHSAAGLLAVIPHLLGFTPENSLVVVGINAQGRVQFAFRYDLPDPPNASTAAEIAGHALSVLVQHNLPVAAVAGYGPGAGVTPLADAFRAAAPGVGVRLHDVLRVEDGRYYSYLCTNPACCAPEGVVFDPAADPAARALTAAGLRVLASREAVAATIAPVTGAAAEAMREATQVAEQAAARLAARSGLQALDRRGLAAVQVAIGTYFEGKCIHRDSDYAWLGLALKRLRIRDDAWARMNPSDWVVYRELWTDVVRHVQPGYVAAPASLLAFAAWQGGDGALANLALDRALADQPDYSLALLLRDVLDAGTPPSAAVLPMTPEQVADSYATPSAGDGPASTGDQPPGSSDSDASGSR